MAGCVGRTRLGTIFVSRILIRAKFRLFRMWESESYRQSFAQGDCLGFALHINSKMLDKQCWWLRIIVGDCRDVSLHLPYLSFLAGGVLELKPQTRQ